MRGGEKVGRREGGTEKRLGLERDGWREIGMNRRRSRKIKGETGRGRDGERKGCRE